MGFLIVFVNFSTEVKIPRRILTSSFSGRARANNLLNACIKRLEQAGSRNRCLSCPLQVLIEPLHIFEAGGLHRLCNRRFRAHQERPCATRRPEFALQRPDFSEVNSGLAGYGDEQLALVQFALDSPDISVPNSSATSPWAASPIIWDAA